MAISVDSSGGSSATVPGSRRSSRRSADRRPRREGEIASSAPDRPTVFLLDLVNPARYLEVRGDARIG